MKNEGETGGDMEGLTCCGIEKKEGVAEKEVMGKNNCVINVNSRYTRYLKSLPYHQESVRTHPEPKLISLQTNTKPFSSSD